MRVFLALRATGEEGYLPLFVDEDGAGLGQERRRAGVGRVYTLCSSILLMMTRCCGSNSTTACKNNVCDAA